MSEYQFIHFLACDRPLDDGAFEFMERQSTRADISRWELTWAVGMGYLPSSSVVSVGTSPRRDD